MCKPRVPSLRQHKPPGLAFTFGGKDHYLGSWPVGVEERPAGARAAADKFIAEWWANGRTLRAAPSASTGTTGTAAGVHR